MTTPPELHELDAPQLRQMVQSLQTKVEARDRELAFKQATIDKITHEMAVLKRLNSPANPSTSTPSSQASLMRPSRRRRRWRRLRKR